MSQQNLNFGTAAPNDGEFLLTAFPKIQANFTELYAITVAAGIPQNLQTLSYTLVPSDAEKHIYQTGAGTTITIPANATVSYPVGTAITFVTASNPMTIAIAADTLILAGSGATGSRALAANSIATAVKITPTSWILSGTGLT